MDIGSIFPLYESDFESSQNKDYERNTLRRGELYALCREALFVVGNKVRSRNKIIMIPSYTCSTVYLPFLQSGWSCQFYNINRDLTIDTSDLLNKYHDSNADICLVHPFYGMDFSMEEVTTLNYIHEKGCIIIEDITQSIFKNKGEFADYSVGSLRKWFPISDGAFLIYNKQCGDAKGFKEVHEFEKFNQDQVDAMYLRGLYYQNKDEILKQISIRLYKRAVETSYMTIEPHIMSVFSKRILLNANIKQIVNRRTENYQYLHQNIQSGKEVQLVVEDISRIKSAPLYFPIYCNDRNSMQKKLAMNHIYAPVLWPLDEDTILVSDGVKYIYDHILCIPIDQRYNREHMKRILDIINGEVER